MNCRILTCKLTYISQFLRGFGDFFSPTAAAIKVKGHRESDREFRASFSASFVEIYHHHLSAEGISFSRNLPQCFKFIQLTLQAKNRISAAYHFNEDVNQKIRPAPDYSFVSFYPLHCTQRPVLKLVPTWLRWQHLVNLSVKCVTISTPSTPHQPPTCRPLPEPRRPLPPHFNRRRFGIERPLSPFPTFPQSHPPSPLPPTPHSRRFGHLRFFRQSAACSSSLPEVHSVTQAKSAEKSAAKQVCMMMALWFKTA